MAQSQLKFNLDGSTHTWEYGPEVARSQLGEIMLLKSTLRLLIILGSIMFIGK
jgi:hypothetical protein